MCDIHPVLSVPSLLVQPNFLENRGPREPGNYDQYMAYLDKLKMQRQEREKELNQRRESMFSFCVTFVLWWLLLPML